MRIAGILTILAGAFIVFYLNAPDKFAINGLPPEVINVIVKIGKFRAIGLVVIGAFLFLAGEYRARHKTVFGNRRSKYSNLPDHDD